MLEGQPGMVGIALYEPKNAWCRMKMPDQYERIQRLEDETAGLESVFEARTLKLWAEIVKLQAKVKELQEHNENRAITSAKEF